MGVQQEVVQGQDEEVQVQVKAKVQEGVNDKWKEVSGSELEDLKEAE
jgi:hypothetical protein